MVSDALLLANPVYHFEESINDMSKYAKLTDHILKEIEYSSDEVRRQAGRNERISYSIHMCSNKDLVYNRHRFSFTTHSLTIHFALF